jgi:hypothetical protein
MDDDASTPQVRTNDNDNLLNIDKTVLGLDERYCTGNTNYMHMHIGITSMVGIQGCGGELLIEWSRT